MSVTSIGQKFSGRAAGYSEKPTQLNDPFQIVQNIIQIVRLNMFQYIYTNHQIVRFGRIVLAGNAGIVFGYLNRPA